MAQYIFILLSQAQLDIIQIYPLEEYCDISNGIHLFANCHNKIDKDPENYPAKLLLSWKVHHKENASQSIEKAQPISNALVYKLELQIVFDRLEQRVEEVSNDRVISSVYFVKKLFLFFVRTN